MKTRSVYIYNEAHGGEKMDKKNVKINADAFTELKIYCAQNSKKIYEVASELIAEGVKRKKQEIK